MALASTVKETEPLPLPLDPELIVIQLSLADADHSHPSGEVTPTLLLPSSASKDALLGESE